MSSNTCFLYRYCPRGSPNASSIAITNASSQQSHLLGRHGLRGLGGSPIGFRLTILAHLVFYFTNEQWQLRMTARSTVHESRLDHQFDTRDGPHHEVGIEHSTFAHERISHALLHHPLHVAGCGANMSRFRAYSSTRKLGYHLCMEFRMQLWIKRHL